MFNVRCSSVGKDKGAVQIQISDGKHLVALGKHGIYCRRPPKLKIQNGDDDTNLFLCSFVAFFFISSLLILPFRVECTCVLLSGIRVNVFHIHVACNHCSSETR